MTKRRFVVFASAAVLLALTIPIGAMLALDTYLHYRFDEVASVNRWGYRGPVVGRKQPNERRLVVMGESTAYGYGVRWQESVPAYLQERLNAGRPDGAPAAPDRDRFEPARRGSAAAPASPRAGAV